MLHLHGRPEPLDGERTYAVLAATVEHVERRRPEPWRLDGVAEYAQRIAGATTGFRLRPGRIVAKAKLSQDESAPVRDGSSPSSSASSRTATRPWRGRSPAR